MAILTRATIKKRHALAFWRETPDISSHVREQTHMKFKIGLGEVPLFQQVTFSVWDDAEAMKAFAYKSAFHGEAVKRVRANGWFKEELYARFAILAAEGLGGTGFRPARTGQNACRDRQAAHAFGGRVRGKRMKTSLLRAKPVEAPIMIPGIAADGSLYPIEKMRAHREAAFHLAISAFVFSEGALLIQRRALSKYHCGGLWANTVCTHPHWGESVEDAAARRLREDWASPCRCAKHASWNMRPMSAMAYSSMSGSICSSARRTRKHFVSRPSGGSRRSALGHAVRTARRTPRPAGALHTLVPHLCRAIPDLRF